MEDNKNEQIIESEIPVQPLDGGSGDGSPKEPEIKSFTQAELDALIDKAFAKGVKKGKKEIPDTQKPEEQPTISEAETRANELIKKANQKLLVGSVRSLSVDLGISERGAKAAAMIANFDDCYDAEGNLDEDAVKDVLNEFVGAWPEFKKKEPTPPYAPGAGTKELTKGTEPSAEEIIKSKLYPKKG